MKSLYIKPVLVDCGKNPQEEFPIEDGFEIAIVPMSQGHHAR